LTAPDAISVAVNVGDPDLADRLTEILGNVPGLMLAHEGETPDVTITDAHPASGDALPPLTPREQQVLALLTEGASNKVIAHALGITPHTAKFHVGRVLDKLDATGRTDAVAHAARLGIVNL